MALLTLQVISDPSLTPSYGAVASTDTCSYTPNSFLHVKNVSGSPDTVTVVVPGTGPYGVAIPDPTVSVPATTGDRMIPIRASAVDPATGLITIQHSATTSVTCALVQVPS